MAAWPFGSVSIDATLPWAGTLSYQLRYGYAAVGCVSEVGSVLDPALIGQRVFAFQPHQEELTARFEHCVRLPSTLSDTRAALRDFFGVDAAHIVQAARHTLDAGSSPA